jgi:GTP-binding protein HflX
LKAKFYEPNKKKVTTAVLVAVQSQQQSVEKTEEYLDELEFLAKTLDITTIARVVQNLTKPDSKYYLGKGKLEELIALVEAEDVDMIIFDDDLSTSQVKNLDREIRDRMIIDRSLLILQIFSKRAQTAQSRLQVELAQYQYMLPRLTNLWTHHSRQRGGIGMKGPGETELETDKRIIRDRIAFLKEKLTKVEKQAEVRRSGRQRTVRVALVGYTNAGKSTLMQLLSKSDIFAENKLFATVDATVRKVVFNNIPFLLTDTVGFIRKLPTTLIESFKSTLDEVVESDILLHVVDISNPAFEEHIQVVNQTLQEIGASDKDTILVFNKIDAYAEPDLPPFEREELPRNLEEWKNKYFAKGEKDIVFISAVKNLYIDQLKEKVFFKVQDKFYDIFPNHEKYEYNKLWLNREVN